MPRIQTFLPDEGIKRTLHPWCTLIIPFRHAKYITLIPIEKTIERFLFHSQYEKNLSEKTLKAYATDLRQFASFMMDQRQICSLPSISAEDLKLHVKSLSGFQPKTMKRKMATLKAMLKLKINIKVPFLLPPVMDSMEVTSIGRKTLVSTKAGIISRNRLQSYLH